MVSRVCLLVLVWTKKKLPFRKVFPAGAVCLCVSACACACVLNIINEENPFAAMRTVVLSLDVPHHARGPSTSVGSEPPGEQRAKWLQWWLSHALLDKVCRDQCAGARARLCGCVYVCVLRYL